MAHATVTVPHISLDMRQVRVAGSVAAAIAEWCEHSDDTSTGIIGPSFATSGPGSGWTLEHTESDYARRAVEGGALYYIDADDGRMVAAIDADENDDRHEDGEWSEDVIRDLGGGHSKLGDWTAHSVVCLECPSIEDAMDHPAIAAMMVQAVIDTHGECSDKVEWAALVRLIQVAGKAMDDIDPDDLASDPAEL